LVQDTRELNRNAVLTSLMSSRPASRKQIAQASGISAATVTRAIDQLIAEGIVTETAEIVSETRGRRAVELDIVTDRSYVVGVDLGASNTRMIVADLLARPLLTVETATPTDRSTASLAAWIAEQARAAAGDLWDRVDHICLGLPGAVSQRDRRISNAPNLPQVEGPTFLDEVEAAMGKPMHFDNDANYALLGEQHFGAARSSRSAAMLTIGSGLGAGLAIDGRILQGERGLIGEFGQLPVGPLGTRLEHMVTGGGILRRAAEAGIELEAPARLFDADASPAVHALRAHFDQALLIVLTATTVACDPETIVLGGGIANSLVSTLDRYQSALEQTLRASPTLAPAELGAFSGSVGAVVAALHSVYAALGVEDETIVTLPAGASLTRQRIDQLRDFDLDLVER
jgi:predicted NBD/HSP70 family sugar kinase/biotin operon repressor